MNDSLLLFGVQDLLSLCLYAVWMTKRGKEYLELLQYAGTTDSESCDCEIADSVID